MKKFTNKVIPALAVLSLLSSCGENDSSGDVNKAPPSSSRPQEQIATDGSNIDGFYLATFQTMNTHLVGTIPGSASFTRKEDRLFVWLRLFAGAPKAWHMQAVYTGTRCPTMSDDTNGDGFIDIVETQAVVGKVLIPLDSDPGTQASGRAFYPLGDLSGSYHYERVVSFNRFFRDLQSEDHEAADNIVKLAAGEGLQIEGKVVVIQGITEETELPETVATFGRHRAFQTLPIACGVYQKVTDTPGSPYAPDEIPGPVAEVDEDQDRPAPENSGESDGESGGTATGGTNESDDGDGPVSDGQDGAVSGGTGGGNSTGRTSGGSSGETSEGGTSTGSTTGGSTGGHTGGSTGGFNGGSSSGGTSGSEGGSTTGGSSTTTSSTSSSSETTTTTTTGSSSSGSSSSSSTGTATGENFGF